MSNRPMTQATPDLYVGVDVGGTNTRIALFESLEKAEPIHIAKFPTIQNYDEQLDRIILTLRASNVPHIAGIGVSVAARIANDGNSIIVAPNLPDYVNKPFAKELVEAFKSPVIVRIAHDPVCGLLAERRFGALQHIDRSAYVTVSTGTGAAIHLGKASTSIICSIELGHQILDGNSLQCLCGQVGCLETFTGGRQVELRTGFPIEQITDQTFWALFTEKLSIGLVNLAQLTRIDVVALSGAIVLKKQLLLPLLQEQVSAKLKGSTLKLKMAALGEDAPIVGAAALLEISESWILH